MMISLDSAIRHHANGLGQAQNRAVVKLAGPGQLAAVYLTTGVDLSAGYSYFCAAGLPAVIIALKAQAERIRILAGAVNQSYRGCGYCSCPGTQQSSFGAKPTAYNRHRRLSP